MGDFIRDDKAATILSKIQGSFPKVKLHFSGSTPPEIFVGRVNYPNVFSGILSPDYKGDTTVLASPEEWVKQNLSIEQVLSYRGSMVYGRQVTNIKANKSLSNVTQQLALASKPVSTEFFLKRQPTLQYTSSKTMSIMANPAPIERVLLEENPFIEKKVDYLSSDYDVKATTALKELYSSNIKVSHLQKLFSAGLLGIKPQRKLVPTKWGITAVDDTLSKHLLGKIKTYKEISEILLFSDNYAGNYYNILLLPGEFKFEVMEESVPNIANPTKQNLMQQDIGFWQDYEGFFGRKNYASSVTGAYYANRLAVCEYLEKMKRQATIIVFRETTEEYYAPLGVGILREVTRKAMQNVPVKPESLQEALKIIDSRIKVPIEKFTKISWIISNYKKQKRLSEF
jgi:DNA repair protein NreA